MAKTFKHATGTLVLRDDQILHLKIKEGIDGSVSDVKTYVAQKRLWSKEKLGLIIDRHESYSAGVDIFEQGMKDLDQDFAAIAYVVYSKVGKVASETVISHELENIPTKIFYSMDEAVSWLKKTMSE